MIIIGALIVVVLRHQMREQQPVQAELETSAEKFRYEMQRSADEVIARMNERIDRLERLVEEADQRSAQLEWQLARIKDNEDYTNGYKPEPPPETDDGFSHMLEESLNEEDYFVANGPIQTVRALNAYQTAPGVHAEPQMARPEKITVPAAEPVGEAIKPAPMEGFKSVREDQPVNNGNNELQAAMVRQLISEGADDDEIARRTRMGKVAIKLIRQMEEGFAGSTGH